MSVDIVKLTDVDFGKHLKEIRLRKGLTLRAFCLKHKVDPGNQSRLERGNLGAPETMELLDFYIKALRCTKTEREELIYLCKRYHMMRLAKEFGWP